MARALKRNTSRQHGARPVAAQEPARARRWGGARLARAAARRAQGLARRKQGQTRLVAGADRWPVPAGTGPAEQRP